MEDFFFLICGGWGVFIDVTSSSWSSADEPYHCSCYLCFWSASSAPSAPILCCSASSKDLQCSNRSVARILFQEWGHPAPPLCHVFESTSHIQSKKLEVGWGWALQLEVTKVMHMGTAQSKLPCNRLNVLLYLDQVWFFSQLWNFLGNFWMDRFPWSVGLNWTLAYVLQFLGIKAMTFSRSFHDSMSIAAPLSSFYRAQH